MPTMELPKAIIGRLESSGLNHRPILLSTNSDVSLGGQPLRHWLVVTGDHLSVVADEPAAEVVRCVRVKDVQSVRTWAGVGSGVLQVKIQDTWVDLVRYSSALSDRFHTISRKLETFRAGADLTIQSDETWDAPRCANCQLRLQSSNETCPRCLNRRQVVKRIWEFLRPQFRSWLMLCGLTCIGVVAELVPPKLQQYMVDHLLDQPAAGLPQGSFSTALLAVVLALAASRALLSFVGIFKGRLSTYIGSSLTHQLRSRMVERLQQLAVAYYDRHQVGSLMSRVAYDSEVLHGLVNQFTGGFLLQVLQLAGVGAMLLWLNPKLAVLTLIPVPLVLFGTWFFWKHVYPRHYRLWESAARQIAALGGMFSGIRVVKAFAQEEREFERFQDSSSELRDSRRLVDYASSGYTAAMQFVFSIGGLIVWYMGGRDVLGQEMTLGALVAFLAYLAMLYAPLATLSSFTAWLTSFLTGSKRVLEVLDSPVTIDSPENPNPLPDSRGEVRFENVTFGYDRQQPVLHNVSFEVRPGEMVGIVGRSGSGKTTLVNLLGRFYDVDEGRVLIDGRDVRDVSLQRLRQRLGIVFQESFLFRGTIWENLRFGRPQATIEQGLAAAKAAGAHDFICGTQLGYETPLGEQGAGLSGGEKQRLSIARTLLCDPQILLLDEATSNIDSDAERSIQRALAVLIQGRTTIVIAHRLATLRNADRILVFDHGRLVEQGSHAELLHQDGLYARLVRLQSQMSKNCSVDRLLTPQVEAPTNENESPEENSLVWLPPQSCQFGEGQHGELFVRLTGQTAWDVREPRQNSHTSRGAFIVRAFPATHSEKYLSVRGWDAEGTEFELGMIADLTEWTAAEQSIIRTSLARRYLVRRIEHIHSLELAHGYLEFDVETDAGRSQFSMRWGHAHGQEFGPSGKLLRDTEDNLYLVPDVEALSGPGRVQFRKLIYW